MVGRQIKFGLSFDSILRKSTIWRMRENGEKLNSTPRIILFTIRGVKGGERQDIM